ncbi:DUF3240 family protein [Pseudohaliea rubra]|uniref:DUF3240 domain-containing protein n=1 Tax=Pseudohaliea rubra DSM 19751 TaxID=1265313 RepID=A0A095VN25_9GAMM|nr:DUF3240 family protein [Pseudohaliea rubra]KGE02775.1 hypothetical protein HRUBRA_02753 [Pseudohaliea rubra DSM 19751]
MTDPRLLTLLAPRERRDDFVDALMSRDDLSGFTLLPALGFSREHSHFSIPEQVAGYREFDRFEVLVEALDLPPLLEHLSASCGRERLRYWVSRVTAEGHLPVPS